MIQQGHQAAGRKQGTRWAWVPVALFAATVAALSQANLTGTYPAPGLLLALNIVFITSTSFFVAYWSARSFLSTGRLALLLFGAGLFLLGAASATSGAVMQRDRNLAITIYNGCLLVTAFCQLAGALTVANGFKCARPKWWLAAGCAGVILTLSFFALAETRDWLPHFFVPGQGGTPVRSMVLGVAGFMLLWTAAIMAWGYYRTRSGFLYYHALGLALLVIGLMAVALTPLTDTALNWTGRVAQNVAGVYLAIGAVLCLRESREWGLPLAQALAQARHRYDLLFDASSDGLVIHGFEEGSGGVLGNFERANAKICTMLGYTEEELLRLSPVDIQLPADLPEVGTELRRLRAHGDLLFEKQLRRKDGSCFPTEIHAKVFEEWGRPMVLAIIRDITQRKRQEEALEEAVRARTRELSETNEQLNSFCYSIAHDLKAPLRAQIGYAGILEEEFGAVLGDAGRGYARRIAQAAQRQHQLVEDLLSHMSLVRAELPLETVNLSALVDQVRTDLDLEIHRRSAVVNSEAAKGFVRANPSSLHLVVHNLLSNALKFVPADRPPQVRIFTEPCEGALRLWVEDNGIGIAAEHLPKLFQVFQRLHSTQSYPGTGIGLAIVRKAAERMGGRAGVESSLGQGSRFWVDLPLAKNDGADPSLPAAKQ